MCLGLFTQHWSNRISTQIVLGAFPEARILLKKHKTLSNEKHDIPMADRCSEYKPLPSTKLHQRVNSYFSLLASSRTNKITPSCLHVGNLHMLRVLSLAIGRLTHPVHDLSLLNCWALYYTADSIPRFTCYLGDQTTTALYRHRVETLVL